MKKLSATLLFVALICAIIPFCSNGISKKTVLEFGKNDNDETESESTSDFEDNNPSEGDEDGEGE